MNRIDPDLFERFRTDLQNEGGYSEEGINLMVEHPTEVINYYIHSGLTPETEGLWEEDDDTLEELRPRTTPTPLASEVQTYTMEGINIAQTEYLSTTTLVLSDKTGEADKPTDEKGSPARLLETVSGKLELLIKVRGQDGITASEMTGYRPYGRRTVDREFEILKDLGILVPANRKNHYRFSDMMIGDSENYTKTMINAINDIKHKTGVKGEIRPLHRGNITKEQRSAVKELIKATVIDQMNFFQKPDIPKDKTLWHIIDNNLLSSSQISSFAQKINKASRKSISPERIWILNRDESVEEAIEKIKMFSPNAIYDVALNKRSDIDAVPDSEGDNLIKMLVFEGGIGDFSQVGGIVAALRTLHLEQEEIIPSLLQIYSVLNNSVYEGDVPPLELLSKSPKEFARQFIFNLPPIESMPIDEIPKLNSALLEILIAA